MCWFAKKEDGAKKKGWANDDETGEDSQSKELTQDCIRWSIPRKT
jgi:hypothetical protein